jgi:hypothetical protein
MIVTYDFLEWNENASWLYMSLKYKKNLRELSQSQERFFPKFKRNWEKIFWYFLGRLPFFYFFLGHIPFLFLFGPFPFLILNLRGIEKRFFF